MNKLFKIIKNNENHYEKIKATLELEVVSNNLKVNFALYCAKTSFKYIDSVKYPDLYEKTSKCLELVADYLLDKKVSREELSAAAYAANAAANAANAAANAAAYAANAAKASANAAYAAYAAAYAANAAYAAAYAANAAAISEANAAYAATREEKLKEMYKYLLKLIFKEQKLDNTVNILYG